MADQFNTLQQCAAQTPQTPASELVKQNSNSMGLMLDLVGAETCTQGNASVTSLFLAAGASFSRGCEQLAVIASAIDQAQKVLSCTIQNLSTSISTASTSEYIVDVSIGDNFTGTNCTISVEQITGVQIATYNSLTSDVQVAMTTQLNQMLETMSKNMQNDKKTGLYTTAEGQKALQSFTTSMQQLINNQSLTNVVSDVFNSFENSAKINFRIGAGTSIKFIDNRPGQLCIKIDQRGIYSLLTQNIVNNAVKIAFNTTGGQDLLQLLENGQTRETTGFQLPDFSLVIIAIILIIVVALTFVKKPDSANGGAPKPILAGPAGKTFGIVLLSIGLAVLVSGVVLVILKKSLILSIGLIIGGILMFIAGLLTYLKARSQETLFKQQLEIAQNTKPYASAVPEKVSGQIVAQ